MLGPFERKFWAPFIEGRDLPYNVRVDGQHYVVCDEDPKLLGRGYGGREFTIRFNDGRVIRTTNLWHQGEIPVEFQPELPDNAVFVNSQP